VGASRRLPRDLAPGALGLRLRDRDRLVIPGCRRGDDQGPARRTGDRLQSHR
jgi:putative transposase